MYSAVVSLHTNPYTCGVARFNRALSEELKTSILPLDVYLKNGTAGTALLSLKIDEMPAATQEQLARFISDRSPRFSYFVHDASDTEFQHLLMKSAVRVFANSRELTTVLSGFRHDIVTVYSPGASVQKPLPAAEIRLLTAGMAHKIRQEGYLKLAQLITKCKKSVRLEVTTALHDGQKFDEEFFSIASEIRSAFNGNVHFCGFLSDEELSHRIQDVDAFVAFFPRGVRENNTTVLSAMAHGCPVITNCDEFTPPWMAHSVTVFDVNSLAEFPSRDALRQVGSAAKSVVGNYDFERLAAILQTSSHV
jgi:hypothetical protein